MPTDTFSIASDADDGGGYWAKNSWPPSPGEALFQEESGTTSFATKDHVTDGNGTFHQENAYFRWDTSSIPDTNTITAATLRLYLIAGDNADGIFSVVADYYDFGGEPVVTGDYTQTATTVVAPLSLALIDVGYNDLAFTDLSGINKTGFTGIRVTLSAGTPVSTTAFNYIEINQHEAGSNFAQLVVTHSAAAAVTQPRRYAIRRRRATSW